MSLFTYFQPFNHDAQTGSWLNKIFAIPAGYAIQARSADGVTVTVNPGFGFDGYRVVLSGTFSFAESGALSSGFVNRADLYGPGGLHISSAQVNTSIEALRNDQSHELHGSDGADTLSAWANTWKIEGGPGNDLLQARNWLYGPEITGGPGADTMTGQAGNEYFFTGDGADSIVGGGGYDFVLFDEAKGPLEVWLDQPAVAGHIRIDNVYQIEGSKFGMTIHGGARADDVYIGGHGVDSIWGGAGDDQFYTGGGQDFVRGETGADLLSGGEAFDDLHGNQGNDTLWGGQGGDWVVGGQDNDELHGDEDDDIVYGNLGKDQLYGGVGHDSIRGGQENDSLMGEAGDDWLSGDRGDDTILGGDGADRIHAIGLAGVDRVMDFSSAQGDRVIFETPGQAYALRFEGGDTVVDLGGGNQVILMGVTQATLGTWLA